MEVSSLGLDGVLEIVPERYRDARGFFSETYNVRRFAEAGIDLVFIQENHSYSVSRGTLRGLHYQLPPKGQDKLLRVAHGAIFDVVVDIRRSSSNFGRWVGIEISADKGNQILVPQGYAHGFITLSNDVEVVYKVTESYSPEYDRSIRWDDTDICIDWPIVPVELQLSIKDREAPALADAEVFP